MPVNIASIAKLTQNLVAPEAEKLRRKAEEEKARAAERAHALEQEARRLEHRARQKAIALPLAEQKAEYRERIVGSVFASIRGIALIDQGLVHDPNRREVWEYHREEVERAIMEELDSGNFQGLRVAKITKAGNYLIAARAGKFPKDAIIEGASMVVVRKIWARLCLQSAPVPSFVVKADGDVEDAQAFRKSLATLGKEGMLQSFEATGSWFIMAGEILRP